VYVGLGLVLVLTSKLKRNKTSCEGTSLLSNNILSIHRMETGLVSSPHKTDSWMVLSSTRRRTVAESESCRPGISTDSAVKVWALLCVSERSHQLSLSA
jgi:hypothetical protein